MEMQVKRLLTTIHLVLWAVVLTIFALTTPTVSAYSLEEGVNAARGTDQPADLVGSSGVLTTFTNILLFVVGALSVIMIIFGGLRYVVSGGNSTAITSAKNTILYAIVGLIISILAFAAINFVLTALAPGSGGADFTDV